MNTTGGISAHKKLTDYVEARERMKRSASMYMN